MAVRNKVRRLNQHHERTYTGMSILLKDQTRHHLGKINNMYAYVRSWLSIVRKYVLLWIIWTRTSLKGLQQPAEGYSPV